MMAEYKKIGEEDREYFASVVGAAYVRQDTESLEHYSHDYTEDLSYLPELVLLPNSAKEASQIIAYCHEQCIPVTPRGAGTGLSGGALPVHGGVSLSCERMNRILEIDEENFQAVVEPGVINEVFQQAVKEKGLFYPPDPASKGSCFLGGNLAENSGGPKAVKYGVTKDYVLDLEVVLPSGELIRTGARVLKNSTGYNLTQLIIGSEGTLAFITKIVFRLIPLPKMDMLMMASFSDAEKACQAVNAIFKAGITPSGLELMERNAVDWAMRYAEVSIPVQEHMQALLLIEVDGSYAEPLYEDCEQINQVLERFGCENVLFADSQEEKERIWKVRRVVGEAVHAHSIYKEEDTVVPRFKLPELLRTVKRLGQEYGFESVCYGHAGDGNLHVNILKGALSEEAWNKTVKDGIRELFRACIRMGGTISGEHGIGLVQQEYMDVAFNSVQRGLLRSIKQAFDPKGIMNPGKILLPDYQ